MSAPRRLTLTVTAEQAGRRVDSLLRHELGLAGSVIRHVKCVPNGITLDGVEVYTAKPVQAGQVLSVLVGDTERRSIVVSVPGPLDVVYEDADLVVVNKAPGMLVHPGHGHFDDTLGNYLLWHYDQEGETADLHPVHRLDKGTSGLLVVAKHGHAQEVLKKQLHTPLFRRVYLAVCDGAPQPPAGVVDAPIGMVPGSLLAREVRPDGQAARTRYETLEVHGPRTLLRLELETGRTHQIRVHMAHIGCPLTGDFLYGVEDKALISRPALHSHALSFRHPVTGEELSFTSPLPADMAALLAIDSHGEI